MRRAPQLGQNPRFLQEKATSLSARQCSHIADGEGVGEDALEPVGVVLFHAHAAAAEGAGGEEGLYVRSTRYTSSSDTVNRSRTERVSGRMRSNQSA
ncbi:hypothetical protein JUNP254_2450 [Klebsiella pneumoniae]|uniref:Uncharacterized protein n=1 Tax=Klebsiella pneumoniae TaxID=573 RepID=A0A809SVS6_KLEPN|nr:hypothetical protein JUNP254_2450 [Klebsiella pneumoniae]BBV24939.1 hypothetical protein [Klebsiella pneumoniae]BBV25037.1 hypothetical protein [Klebsiella pneumoniae]BBV28245.1 hypothetical protein [Klebsiella pneumoniae]BCT23396.1 hypothetical protein [Klebsiella pneumoniae]